MIHINNLQKQLDAINESLKATSVSHTFTIHHNPMNNVEHAVTATPITSTPTLNPIPPQTPATIAPSNGVRMTPSDLYQQDAPTFVTVLPNGIEKTETVHEHKPDVKTAPRVRNCDDEHLHSATTKGKMRSLVVPDYSAPCEHPTIFAPYCKLPVDPAFGSNPSALRVYPTITTDTTWLTIFELITDYNRLWDAWKPFSLTDYESSGDMWTHMFVGVAVAEPNLKTKGTHHMFYPPIAGVNLFFTLKKQWKNPSQNVAIHTFFRIAQGVRRRIKVMSFEQAAKEVDDMFIRLGTWTKVAELLNTEPGEPSSRYTINGSTPADTLHIKVLSGHLISFASTKEAKRLAEPIMVEPHNSVKRRTLSMRSNSKRDAAC